MNKMIKWKKVGEHVPTNANKPYIGETDSPYVPCIVWVCNPDVIRGGTIDVIRWDTENKCWLQSDMMGNWMYIPEYKLQITHFCDDINMPEE